MSDDYTSLRCSFGRHELCRTAGVNRCTCDCHDEPDAA